MIIKIDLSSFKLLFKKRKRCPLGKAKVKFIRWKYKFGTDIKTEKHYKYSYIFPCNCLMSKDTTKDFCMDHFKIYQCLNYISREDWIKYNGEELQKQGKSIKEIYDIINIK